MTRAAVLRGLLALVPAAEGQAQRLLHAGAYWAAIERSGAVCEAVSRSEIVASPGRPQARAVFAFSRDGKRRGELHLIFARPVRPGAAAVLSVGAESFLLVTRGTSAWSRGPAQEAAIIAAIRRSAEMRVRAQGQGGRISDRYLLGGAPTAIDAAAIACA
ncbi:hypothetical protein [Sphingomonas glaciei]|uniref:Uncharacterized protein n=1 Tax=Sphingomonas glaciei TaxID=2938948 RepID=A0ABY5MTV7_9SPHN|nr:hypothetical protein [Sphingomonas glaciei]UUR07522.1 hypothetical protein M1K48_11330 [Sphingomonas glaciei]